MVLGSGIRDPGSGKNLFRIPDPGVKNTGYRVPVLVGKISNGTGTCIRRENTLRYRVPVLIVPALRALAGL